MKSSRLLVGEWFMPGLVMIRAGIRILNPGLASYAPNKEITELLLNCMKSKSDLPDFFL